MAKILRKLKIPAIGGGARGRNPDYFIVVIAAAIVLFGLAMLSSASSDLGKIRFGDTYYYLKHQVAYGFSIGAAGFVFGAAIYYRRWQKLAAILLAVNVVFLLAIFLGFGFKAGGAERWLKIGPFLFQPSEMLKLTFMFYLAAWLAASAKRTKSFWEGFLPLIVLAGAIALLLIFQPSTSTVVIILFSGAIVYFLSGAKLRYIAGLFLLGTAGFLSLIFISPYRFERMTAFMNPAADVQGAGYHINQALIAVGSGGLWGTGYGQSTSKFSYLPEPIGDSIFVVIAEELGFIGAAVFTAAFFFLVFRGFLVAWRCREQFGRLLAAGIVSVIAIQTVIHIGANIGILPLTGVPLPLVSYGGTSLAVFMTALGILVNISKYS